MSEISDQNIENEKKEKMYSISSSSSSLSALATASSSIIKSSVLRPSAFQLSSANAENKLSSTNSDNSNNANPFLLNTSNMNNDDDCEASPVNNDDGSDKNKNSKDDKNEKELLENKSDPLTMLNRNGMQKSNLLSSVKTTPSSQNSSFVFGQNLRERVTGENIQNSESVTNENDSKNNQTNSNEGNNHLLFSNATTTAIENSSPIKTSIESLTEVARAYEESRAQKRKFLEVETFTGEEDEVNVLDVNSKLFTFVASNWEERGPGNLRVNDAKDKSSRVVFRTSGNLRVLLNTKVWPGMVVEKPSIKSLRLTAIDSSGQIKIYLAMARPDDISNLYSALNKRIELEKLKDSDTNVDTTENEITSSVNEPSPKKIAIDDSSN